MLRRLDTGVPINMLESLFAEDRGIVGRPWVMLNMVASIDGATAVRGGATALNDADDRALFLALRAVADVVLMGAQTVRSENLGPVRMDDAMTEQRELAGLDGEPRLAILSRSLDLDPDTRVFSDQTRRPLIVTGGESDPERLRVLGAVADIVEADSLDGGGIVDALGEVRVILCEGGPTVNSLLFAAGRVDEVDVTVSPLVALGESKRIAAGAELDPPLDMTLERIWHGDRSLFLRYVRA